MRQFGALAAGLGTIMGEKHNLHHAHQRGTWFVVIQMDGDEAVENGWSGRSVTVGRSVESPAYPMT